MRAGDKLGIIGLFLSIASVVILVIIIINPHLTDDSPIYCYVSLIIVGSSLIISVIGLLLDHSIPGKIGAVLSAIVLILTIIFILV